MIGLIFNITQTIKLVISAGIIVNIAWKTALDNKISLVSTGNDLVIQMFLPSKEIEHAPIKFVEIKKKKTAITPTFIYLPSI